MENKLYKSKILFITPSFFDYEKEIKAKLEERGYKVDLYDDRPTNKSLGKILIRINPRLLSFVIHRYYKKIILENKDKNYDYIFFIKCESPLKKDLELLKRAFPNAKFILYMYDSISNIKYYSMKKQYFDDIFTFDYEDAISNYEMKFRPLFYLDCYSGEKKENNEYEYCFIGSCHSDRPKIINNLLSQVDQKNNYFRMYVPSKIVNIIKTIFDKDFRELKKKNIITLEKISSEEVSNIYGKSKIIIDIQHPLQSGLTMRTIEVLGLKKKMITTNEGIKKYSFYSKNNIEILNRKNPIISDSFIETNYEELDTQVYEDFSLDNWVTEIFGGRN